VDFICKSEADLLPAAAQLINAFPDSRVFALYGKMGAGKTTFIKVLCKMLGATDVIQSPSFAIINEYSTLKGDPLFHFDFYRIKKIEEAMDIGCEEYFYSGNYCFIEWPELIEALLPEGTVHVEISGDPERTIKF
jgi:tRNA threonylcarbamoyladenosine biosynthesis protein TsaE